LSSSLVCRGSGCDSQPQVCVDWCDAYAYCRAVGKRMCGKIGGGSNEYADQNDAGLSQWYNACSSHGANSDYPYGDTYQAAYCNGYDLGLGTTVPVGSMPSCQSSVPGYAGIYDLSGNVWEWEDSCEGPGQSARCHRRGGTFEASVSYMTCQNGIAYFRNGVVLNTGLRCCSP
jgi:sulfatase modifying factor 1